VERTKKRCFDKSKRLAVATVATALLHRQQQQDFFLNKQQVFIDAPWSSGGDTRQQQPV
jgi:hypothetical protein